MKECLVLVCFEFPFTQFDWYVFGLHTCLDLLPIGDFRLLKDTFFAQHCAAHGCSRASFCLGGRACCDHQPVNMEAKLYSLHIIISFPGSNEGKLARYMHINNSNKKFASEWFGNLLHVQMMHHEWMSALLLSSGCSYECLRDQWENWSLFQHYFLIHTE